MKIRIKENSVRLRLTKSEVAQFCSQGKYSQLTNFGNQIFTYTLISDEGKESYKAEFENSEIRISIPYSDLIKWKDENCIGFSHNIKFESGNTLSIKVEKDFVCLDETSEDQSDNYPNPRLKED